MLLNWLRDVMARICDGKLFQILGAAIEKVLLL